MNDSDAFLAAIRANPDDDAPRLIYADWLDDADGCTPVGRVDHERAELIRIGVELATFPENFDSQDTTTDWKKRDRLINRVRHLANHANGIGVIYDGLREAIGQRIEINYKGWGTTGLVYEVRRGFVHTVTASLATLIGGVCERCNGEEIWEHPSDRKVNCRHCSGLGRTAGILPQIVRSDVAVVERVVASDKMPRESGGVFYWHGADDDGVGQTELPMQIYKYTLPDTCSIHNFRSRDDALNSLSAALIRYATESAEVAV